MKVAKQSVLGFMEDVYPLGIDTSYFTNWLDSIDENRIKSYQNYWDSLRPKTEADFIRVWLFAFMSIHTTWESNVRGYEALKDLKWMNNKKLLREKLVECKAGLYNMRTDRLWKFRNQWMEDSSQFYKKTDETWQDYRDRLTDNVYGIGLAKTSFVIEMAYPNADICCLDVHILRYLGKEQENGALNKKTYRIRENYWIDQCRQRGYAPAMVRHYYWDDMKGYNDTRYWSYVLEGQKRFDLSLFTQKLKHKITSWKPSKNELQVA
jgi:thermostable 8-oxoguanine DNA glycosylase